MNIKSILSKTTIFSLLFVLLQIGMTQSLYAQISIGGDDEVDYARPKQYEIGGITVSGVEFLDPNVLIMLSGLHVGKEIQVPGDDISGAIKKLWKQGLFDDVKVSASRIEGDLIFINIDLKEVPRLSKYSFKGVKRTEAESLREDIKIMRGDVVTDNLIQRTHNIVKKHYVNKGFWDADVNIRQIKDTTQLNYVSLQINIKKNKKVKIKTINVVGNESVSDWKVKHTMKNTKEKTNFKPFDRMHEVIYEAVKGAVRLDPFYIADKCSSILAEDFKVTIFKVSKYIESQLEEDKASVIEKYNALGYRDAIITKDSVYRNEDGSLVIDLHIDEGNKYYFRNINWIGNTIYKTEFLDAVLGIQKGDVYNQKVMDANLTYNPNGTDITSLYMDRGYLFFNVQPVEALVENDSIDLEMRIYEGEQARIKRVSISGNNTTNDHVVIRELRTRPGQLFSRDALIRTQRELAQLGYFDAEKILPTPIPNPADNTVDIEYKVEETSSDQIELSGGWGYGRLIGTLGLKFSNFSARNLFNKKAWRPVPTGDGQELSLRFQTYGQDFYNLSTTFTEPWLGGKKPNRLSVSYSFSKYSDYRQVAEGEEKPSLAINGVSVSLTKRLTWPDDFFQISQAVNLQQYKTKNYKGILPINDEDGSGIYNKVSYQLTLMRNSVSQPIYPRTGSSLMASMELSPPYSLFSNKDYANLEDSEKFRWMEFHKWRFQSEYFKTIAGDLVLMARAKYGFIGAYNNDIGVMPFDHFFLGGDGMAGYYNFDGREQIGFRGYTNASLTQGGSGGSGATIYNKNTLELRYPLSLNPSATIFVLGYAEAGNTWMGFGDFAPFNLYRSAGVGVRIFLPIFGVLGLDWGYGFDEVPGMPSAGGSQFHFSINNSID